ncbi:MAG: hypothetical protein IT305_32375 [Chloroflexi bacterium]|nr:hypothetical protein [Chloroflexota bacterium]
MKRHRNVMRVDRRNFHGWVVQVKRRGRGHFEGFADSRHGGQAGALRQALARRDDLEAELPPATHLREKDVRSRTGVVGVTLVRRQRRGRVLRYWCANWVELDGRRVSRSFAASTYGAARARALAERTRRQAVARILGSRGLRPWFQR